MFCRYPLSFCEIALPKQPFAGEKNHQKFYRRPYYSTQLHISHQNLCYKRFTHHLFRNIQQHLLPQQDSAALVEILEIFQPKIRRKTNYVRFFGRFYQDTVWLCIIKPDVLADYVKKGVRTFRPMPFQPLQFQPLQFQPFTLSTVHTFNRVPFQPHAISAAANSTASII